MQDTFALLALSPDPDENGELKTSWPQMKNSSEANNETFVRMSKVEEDMLDAVHQRNLRNSEISFRGHDEDPGALSGASMREEVKKFSGAVGPYNRRFLEM
jgi:hypothetical protein